MPSFSESLEKTLHNALKAASERHHEYATLEHLLLALIDDEHGSQVMSACGVDLAELKGVLRTAEEQALAERAKEMEVDEFQDMALETRRLAGHRVPKLKAQRARGDEPKSTANH